MLIERTGDLFASDAPAIGHGVNCKGVMGAGIAKQFRKTYVKMYYQYRLQCEAGMLKPGQVLPWLNFDVLPGPRLIMNIASQDEPGANARMDWLFEGTLKAVRICQSRAITKLALPQIGCGIGGLKWATVKSELSNLAKDTNFDIEVWSL